MKASITLKGERAELARLQDFADDFAQKCGFPDHERSQLLIILEELFTNAATHGRARASVAGQVTIVLGWKMGRLRISFMDDGQPFDPLTFRSPELEGPPEERPVGGLGIHIVRSLVHRARYRRRHSRNYLYLVRRVESPSGEPG